MEILDSLRFAHGRLRLAGHALALDVDGAAGQVVERPAVGPEREPEIAVAELVEHPARCEGSEVMRSSTSMRSARGSNRNR